MSNNRKMSLVLSPVNGVMLRKQIPTKESLSNLFNILTKIAMHLQIQWITLLPMALISISMPTMAAQIVPWQDNIPSSLSPFQNKPQLLAQLAQQNIIIYGLPAQRTHLPTLKNNPQPTAQFMTAAVVVPASSQQVAQLLQDYPRYVGLFPTLKSAKLLAQQGTIRQMQYQIHIPTPIPVLNFKETVRMQHQVQGNSIATIILDAPIPYGLGKLEWFALGPKQTLVTVTQWGDLDQPKGFIFSKILKALPDAKLGIPSGTNVFILEALQQRFSTPKAQALAPDQLPELKLSSSQWQKVAELSRRSGQPVTFIYPLVNVQLPSGREDMRFSSSVQYYPQAAAKLQPWLAPQSFQQLFPRQIKQVKTENLGNHLVDARYKISVGLGVISIPFRFQLRFDQHEPNQRNFVASGGDLRMVQGQMRIYPYGNASLLSVTSAAKIDEKAPFLLRAARSLPYADMLPAVGGNTVLTQKIKQKLS